MSYKILLFNGNADVPQFNSLLSFYWLFTFSNATGCGRKKSPIWEYNQLKTKEDTANVPFYFWKVHRMSFYMNVF